MQAPYEAPTVQRTATVSLNPEKNGPWLAFRYIVRVIEHNGHAEGKVVALTYLDDAADIGLIVDALANTVEYIGDGRREVDAETFFEYARREEIRNPKHGETINFRLNRRG